MANYLSVEWGLAVLLSGQIIWQVALLSIKLREALGKGLNNSQAGTLEGLKKLVILSHATDDITSRLMESWSSGVLQSFLVL